MSTNISMTTALLVDPVAMLEFLSTIPNGDQLGKILQDRTPLASRAYDDDTWTARFVASDGYVVKCFAVSEITIDQAEMIAAAGVDIVASDEAAFREAVEQALGPTFDAGD
jgi:hypothetical protein